jgi:hypothetical protein
MNLVAGCHGRFHGILPKKYSRTFHELNGDYKEEMPTNIWGQWDIVTHSTNIINKVYPLKEALFCQRDFSRY